MPPDLTARVGEPSPVPRMTLDEIDKALAVCGRATKGPWFSKWEEHEGAFRVYVNDSDGGRIKVSPMIYKDGFGKPCAEAESDFIAHARTGYPAALLALKAAMEREAALVALMSLARCPDCDGSGATAEHHRGCDGTCRDCPVQVQCRWCYERTTALSAHAKAGKTQEVPNG